MTINIQVFSSKEKLEETGLRADISLSVSKAKTFDTCKAKFKYQYITKLPKKDWEHLVFGKFLHQVLENFHIALINNPENKKYWEDQLKIAWKDAVKEYSEKITDAQKLEAGPIVKGYRDLIREEGLPNVVGVETDFNIIVDDGTTSVLLNGFIDRVQIDLDEMTHVADYKTTKDLKYLKKDFFQLETYAFALMNTDETLDKIRCSYIGLRHDFKFLTKEYDRSVLDSIGNKIIEYAKNIQEEKMWRPQPQPLCKYCDFQDNCRAGERYLIKLGVKKSNRQVGQLSW